MRHLLVAAALVIAAVSIAEAAPHWEADLSWQQTPPDTETAYRVDRKLGLTGTWAALATLGSNVLAYRDVGPYQDGQVVCWRVTPLPENPDGSNVGDEFCLGAPVQYPGKVGGLSVKYIQVPN